MSSVVRACCITCSSQCWAPKPILGSVGYLLADRRIKMSSVFGNLKKITETETENFPVDYWSVISRKWIFWATFAPPWKKYNVFFECSRHITSR